MGRRYKLRNRPGYYVERDRKGRFKRWAKIKRSLAQDRVWEAPLTTKSGYGHRYDKKKPEEDIRKNRELKED